MAEETRRDFLRVCGTATLAGLGGCLGGTPGAGGGAEPPSRERFDPRVDGFGFRNWGTAGDRYPGHDHDAVSREEIRRVVERDWSPYVRERNWLDVSVLPSALRETIVKQLYVSINQGSATDGHCFGMVETAIEYFETPTSVPATVDSPSGIERPTGAVGDTIDFHHNRQLLDPHTWGAWMLLYSEAELAYSSQLPAIRSAIDDDGVASLGLATWPRLRGHAVLAYDYVDRGDETVLEVYDPDWAAPSYDSRTPTLAFDTGGERPTLRGPYRERFDRVVLIGSDLELPALVRAGEGFLRRHLLGGLLTVFVTTDVELSVVDGSNAELRRRTADHASTEPTEYANVRYRFGDPAGEYTVRLSGSTGTEYTLEVEASSREGFLIDREVEGSFDASATHEYLVTVPASPTGRATVERTG